jgi:hypothetical protein
MRTWCGVGFIVFALHVGVTPQPSIGPMVRMSAMLVAFTPMQRIY